VNTKLTDKMKNAKRWESLLNALLAFSQPRSNFRCKIRLLLFNAVNLNRTNKQNIPANLSCISSGNNQNSGLVAQ
ncbi:hypothetical protein ACJUDV_004547, partial [Vibrio vulnificus]